MAAARRLIVNADARTRDLAVLTSPLAREAVPAAGVELVHFGQV